MLFSEKIPFHAAARLTPGFWVPHLLRFATVRHYSRLFTIIRNTRDYWHYLYYSYYLLFAIRDYSLFAIRNYLQLFAIRVLQTLDCLHARQGSSSTRGTLSTYLGTQPGEVAF